MVTVLLLLPIVQCELLCLADVHREVVLLVPVLQVSHFLWVRLLFIIRDQAQHNGVISKLYDGGQTWLHSHVSKRSTVGAQDRSLGGSCVQDENE